MSVAEAREKLREITRENDRVKPGVTFPETPARISPRKITPESVPPSTPTRRDLYGLLCELEENHDADRALIEKRENGRAAVVLEFEIGGDGP